MRTMDDKTAVESVIVRWLGVERAKSLRRLLRKVLGEVKPDALLALNDTRLQVIAQQDAYHSVWAYFPMHRKRRIARELKPRDSTRVLLVFGIDKIKQAGVGETADYLRDHIGHCLLYLRSPKAENICANAMAEWHASSMRTQALSSAPAR
jgi:hypothetical protein